MADLQEKVDPQPPAIDTMPTIAVDLPEGMSFSDFDSDEPANASLTFNPEVDGTLDDDGIPVWEDPA